MDAAFLDFVPELIHDVGRVDSVFEKALFLVLPFLRTVVGPYVRALERKIGVVSQQYFFEVIAKARQSFVAVGLTDEAEGLQLIDGSLFAELFRENEAFEIGVHGLL